MAAEQQLKKPANTFRQALVDLARPMCSSCALVPNDTTRSSRVSVLSGALILLSGCAIALLQAASRPKQAVRAVIVLDLVRSRIPHQRLGTQQCFCCFCTLLFCLREPGLQWPFKSLEKHGRQDSVVRGKLLLLLLQESQIGFQNVQTEAEPSAVDAGMQRLAAQSLRPLLMV